MSEFKGIMLCVIRLFIVIVRIQGTKRIYIYIHFVKIRILLTNKKNIFILLNFYYNLVKHFHIKKKSNFLE